MYGCLGLQYADHNNLKAYRLNLSESHMVLKVYLLKLLLF